MEKVNLNEANRRSINKRLQGIGPLVIERIKQHQEVNGPINAFSGLSKIPGIGKKKMEILKNNCEFNQTHQRNRELNQKSSNLPCCCCAMLVVLVLLIAYYFVFY